MKVSFLNAELLKSLWQCLGEWTSIPFWLFECLLRMRRAQLNECQVLAPKCLGERWEIRARYGASHHDSRGANRSRTKVSDTALPLNGGIASQDTIANMSRRQINDDDKHHVTIQIMDEVSTFFDFAMSGIHLQTDSSIHIPLGPRRGKLAGTCVSSPMHLMSHIITP